MYLYKYSRHSKGYVFIGVHEDGNITKIESWDVTFLENNFLSKNEIDKDLQFYELMDPNTNFIPI